MHHEQGDAFGVTVLSVDRTNYVILDFKLLTWKYMNFTKKFDENTRIFTIKVLEVINNDSCSIMSVYIP